MARMNTAEDAFFNMAAKIVFSITR